MDKFDLGFNSQPYPQILLIKGWRSLGQMTFELEGIKILFDTSDQFQITRDGKAFSDHYANSMEEFLAILEKLGEDIA